MAGNESKVEVYKASSDHCWLAATYENKYLFIDNSGDEQKVVTTPGGVMLQTSYQALADRILMDLELFGTECMSAESILPWHYTMVENFSKMEHKEVEAMLDACFLQKHDWTYDDGIDDGKWIEIFGEPAERKAEIRDWMSKCTHMQLTGACCIGNAYHSINVAFVLATLMENYKDKALEKQFRKLANLIADNSFYGPASDLMKEFNTFDLYYGIHLSEDGAIINHSSVTLDSNGENELEDDSETYQGLAKELIEDQGMEFPDVHALFDTKKLCDDIISYCKGHYGGSSKLTEEFFISAYYDALCLAIHHIKDENSFSKDNAYQFLQSKCDTEFCDVYSDRLLGYSQGDSDSDNIWELYGPYLREVLNDVRSQEELTDEMLHAAMEPAFAIGVAVANEYYDPSDEVESDYVGAHVDVASLVGRNYYRYLSGVLDEEQPFILSIDDIEACESDEDEEIEDEDEEHDFRTASLSAFVPKECWVKKIDASENGYEANRLVVVELDTDSKIVSVTELLEEVQRMGGGMFMIPGMEMPASCNYSMQTYLSDEAKNEIELLLKGRIIPQNFSFVGKKLPQGMIDEGGNGGDNTNYTYANQSAYRQAYMHMSIDTTEDGVIEGFDYSSYQSTGSGYWDMFSRPQGLDDKHEEIVDMFLYIIDKYSDEEYQAIVGGKDNG